MTRSRGRAPRGERVVDQVPAAHWKTMTVIGAMDSAGCRAAMSIDAATTGDIFLAFVEQVLVPTLGPGDVVVMDNLWAHKRPKVVEAIRSVGAGVLYLPPYSPDYNPIEPMWSKVKTLLRELKARTIDTLHEAIGRALRTITGDDAEGYFDHCGYPVH